MSHVPRRHRAGFKRIDVLAATVATLVAAAAAIPAVYSANLRDERTQCMSHMRHVALAMLAYESVHQTYPGYSNPYRQSDRENFADPATGEKRGVSWVVPLLGYLDQEELEREWRKPGSKAIAQLYSAEDEPGAAGKIPLLICPADAHMLAKKCGLSYVVNCGMKDCQGVPARRDFQGSPRDWAENGVFFDLFNGNPRVGVVPGQPNRPIFPIICMTSAFIRAHDGLSETCLLSENVDAGTYIDDTESTVGMVWNGAGKVDMSKDPPSLNPPDARMRIAAGLDKPSPPADDPIVYARPSSPHSGGVNMAFCDGQVRFVRDDVDYYVYCLLMSPNGRRVRLPGTSQVLPDFGGTSYESWYIRD